MSAKPKVVQTRMRPAERGPEEDVEFIEQTSAALADGWVDPPRPTDE